MPGRGSFGPAGRWVYQRAERLREKNPDMKESTSFAIAQQQAHKVGKSLKSFMTPEGVRTAKAKMTRPVKEYRKTASLSGFFDEFQKLSGYASPERIADRLAKALGIPHSDTKPGRGKSARAHVPSQPYTVRAKRRGEPKPPRGPKVEQKRSKTKRPSSASSKPKAAPVSTKQLSKLRRYGVPAAVLGTAAVGGGLAYAAHRRKEKKDKSEIDSFFKGASHGFFDELEKIAQGRAGGDLSSMGKGFGTGAAPSDAPGPASASDLGMGGGGAGGPSQAPTPTPPPPIPTGGSSSSIPSGGAPGGAGGSSASDLGIPSGGSPMGGSASAPSAAPPPPPPPSNPSSLLGKKGPSTGTLSSSESAEVGGSGKGGGLSASDLGI